MALGWFQMEASVSSCRDRRAVWPRARSLLPTPVTMSDQVTMAMRSLGRGSARLAALCLIPSIHAVMPAVASAQTIVDRNEHEVDGAIRIVEGRTAGPNARFYAALVSLCGEGVRIAATAPPSGFEATDRWAQRVRASVAVNGDYFRLDHPYPHVHGDAVGDGIRWPDRNRLGDPKIEAGEASRHGFIAFGDGWVEFSHTALVKQNPSIYAATQGFRPTEVTTDIPDGTLALVSGYSELVTEGRVMTCGNPTGADCWYDRADLRQRHPRTAMGLSEDRRTFILLVVDGRGAGGSEGMIGVELAWLIHELGAFQAYNLDGGGSSMMWVRGSGTINHPSDGTPRSVANHWAAIVTPEATPTSCPDDRATPTDGGAPSADGGIGDAAVGAVDGASGRDGGSARRDGSASMLGPGDPAEPSRLDGACQLSGSAGIPLPTPSMAWVVVIVAALDRRRRVRSRRVASRAGGQDRQLS